MLGTLPNSKQIINATPEDNYILYTYNILLRCDVVYKCTSHGVNIYYLPRVVVPLHPPRAHGENTLLIYSISCAARSRIAWQPPPVTPFPFIF